MVRETTAYVALFFVMIAGMAGILYGMYMSAGQNLNPPSIAGGIVLLASLAMMLYVSVSTFKLQDRPTHGQD
jgi:hypothetical protein